MDGSRKIDGSVSPQGLTLFAVLERHEGQTIKALLDEAGKNVQQLADACGVAWPAAKKYIKAKRLGAKAWETCSVGLRKLGIEPSKVRLPVTVEAAETVENLKELLKHFREDQLEDLRRIAKAGSHSRERLVDAIDGILLWKKK